MKRAASQTAAVNAEYSPIASLTAFTSLQTPTHHTASATTSTMTHYVAPALCAAVFGGWIYGYNLGITSGLTTSLISHTYFPEADPTTQSLYQGVLTSSILMGGMLGSFGGAAISDASGRQTALLLTGVIDLCAAVLQSLWTFSFLGLVLTRTMLGLAVGMAGVCVPQYVSEVTHGSKYSGKFGVCFQIAICATILLAQGLNLAFNPDGSDEIANWVWQVQLALGAIPGAILALLCMLQIIPESPMYAGKLDESEVQQRQQLTNGSDSDSSEWDIQNTSGHNSAAASPTARGTAHYVRVDANSNEQPQDSSRDQKTGWKQMMSRGGMQHMGVALILAAASQLTGINIIILYAPSIFSEAAPSVNPLLLTLVCVGVWNLLSVFLSFALVDKLGRKVLMLGALSAMFAAEVLMGLAYSAFSDQKSALAIAAIIIFVGAYETG